MHNFKYISDLSEICPNLDKIDESYVYRLIKDSVPNNDDFIPSYYFSKRKYWKAEDDCKAKGLSLFEDIKDVGHLLNNIPNQKHKYKSIYKSMLNNDSGEIYKTPAKQRPTHRTFYANQDCDELVLFTEKADEWN